MSVRILVGDALAMLKTLPDVAVNCILSSPPYYQLRDYGVDGQIGLEETPEQFVAALVDVFREARRVLRDDGVAFINIGDSYAGSGRGAWNISDEEKDARGVKETYRPKVRAGGTGIGGTAREAANTKGAGEPRVPSGLKPKDLIGIPWMLAFALRADGWYLRQEIIWHKPNPMPESVRDRCTKAHEHVFLLSKSQTYLYDAEAIAEPSIYAPGATAEVERPQGYYEGKWAPEMRARGGRNDGSFKAIRETRNKRDVWTIPTEPSSIAHYAMMPTELAKTCIMAGCPLGGTVLDPFGGAGTTGLVADRLQRSAILIELSPEHAHTARDRLKGEMGMFGSVE